MDPMEINAPLPAQEDRLSALPDDILPQINDRIPCLVLRRRLARACAAFRDAVNPQHEAAATPPLPWILLPRPGGGPSFSCVLSGCHTHELHLDVPADARAASYFGSYEGGWVFLATGQIYGHALLNLRSYMLRRPSLRHRSRSTASSPPSEYAGKGTPYLEDVIHHDGVFYFLSLAEHLLMFAPVVHEDGDFEITSMGTRRFQREERHYDEGEEVAARYLVESHGQLLMVVRISPPLGFRLPTSAFRVFQMVQAPARAPIDDNGGGENNNIADAEYTWNELHDLGGRMLFVGRGCSRSYDVANYPGFRAGVYFLDDERIYGEETMIDNHDIGKWLSSEPIPSIDNFLPEKGPSVYSPPACVLCCYVLCAALNDVVEQNYFTMEAPLLELDLLNVLPPHILRLINDRIPCLVRRRSLALVCPAFRDAVNPQHEPATPLLPWILLPRPGGPSFSCVLRGCATHDLDLDIPADARAARYFGAYEGGWVFLATGQIDGHALLNLRTHQCFDIPDGVNSGGAIVAATLSSPPEHEHCVVAAIDQLVGGRRVPAFWHLGHPVPLLPYQIWSLEDVIHHNGAFHFLTDEEDLLVFAPLVHDDGRLEMISMGIHFGHQRHHDGDARIRYLVESRGELLIVVRLTPHLGQPTSSFRVFQMEQALLPAADDNGGYNHAEYTWNELHDLGGRMLFVGRGCSRSYDVANYPGFRDGVYFLDDGRFYDEEGIFTGADAQATHQYPCRDIGKWLSSEPIHHIDNYLPEEGPSIYSPPAWFLS
uniref:KIB1-4 beta-propeller domain-containing protein n=1 Tax=Leersia perrieri TaxID=77586 RepID=A0A0D9WJW9_9ORYZ